MPLLKEKTILAAKVETTIGTAETLADAQAVFNAYNITINADIEVEEREGAGAFNRLAGVPGRRGGSLSFTTDVEYDGTASMPEWAGVLLPMCGWVESSQVYTPRTEAPGDNVKTGTLAVYEDGLKKTLAGAMGTFRFVCPSGRKAYIEWEFQGVWQAVVDATILAGASLPTDTTVRYASATTTFAGTSLCVEQITFDAGNNIIMRECATTDGGYISALITDRYPTITANPEATLVATDNPYGDWLAGTQGALSVALDGPAPVSTTSTITLSAPKAQIETIAEGDRDMMLIDDITWRCQKNGGTNDQELSITFAESTA